MHYELSIRFAPPDAPAISVDGALETNGLQLSHWPGNRTPRELRRDLSTEIALAFAELPEPERERISGGARLIVNNHFDTDGVLAMFAIARPNEALARRAGLLDAAAAGDFFRAPSELALCIDAIVTAFADRERSPIASRFVGLSDEARFTLAVRELVPRLAALFDGAIEPYRALWHSMLQDWKRGTAELALAARDELVHLDWTIWTSNAATFAPGRHALFGSTARDRVLVVAAREHGTRYRLIFSTLSWFDLASAQREPRPDLASLAAHLNELEGVGAEAELAWRAQPTESPSPEVWFGSEGLEWFSEHNERLGESRLAPSVVRREIAEHLRTALAIPE